MKGRKPEPTKLRVLRGSPGHHPFNTQEPTPTALPNPTAPEWLDGEAKAEWVRLAPILGRLGLITETDTNALAAYCEAWATWKTATQQIRKYGMVLKSKDSDIPKVSPFVKIAHNALLQMRALLLEFGMTPSSRVRMRTVETRTPITAPVGKWAGLLK
jgi:P27 family predicted phage terminase small subunit